MGAGRKTQAILVPEPSPARNLLKKDLGGTIFGCKDATMKECLKKQLFGLPSTHFSYVRNIEPGLPLFLFSYTNRTMYGIFEAACHGQMNIDPYAWTENGAQRTPFPAQVRVYTKTPCQPLSEKQFKSVIEDNYYAQKHFWFELDHAQAKGLMLLFKPASVPVSIKQAPFPSNKSIYCAPLCGAERKATNSQENQDIVVAEGESKYSTERRNVNKFESLDGGDEDKLGSSSNTSSSVHDEETKEQVMEWGDYNDNIQGNHSMLNPQLNRQNIKLLERHSTVKESEADMKEVLHKLKELSVERTASSSSKDCRNDNFTPCISQDVRKEDTFISPEAENRTISELQENSKLVQVIKALTERTEALEKKQAESDKELQQLRDVVEKSGRTVQGLRDQVKELESKLNSSMSLGETCIDQYGEPGKVIYLLGGYDGTSWLSAFDAFSPSEDKLMPLKPMSSPRSYAGVAALDDNIYVFGGGDGNSWYTSVECYNQRENKWALCPNLNHPKGSLAGATLNSKIYAIGGGDGVKCLSDVEMYDPILGKWINSQLMFDKRFATAAVEHDGVLYAVGGYNGDGYLMSAERYDPREAYWTRLPSMNVRRGCHSLAVLNGKIYAMGGYDGEEMVASVEIFDPRLGSWMIGEPMNFARGYAAASVLGDTLFVIGGLKSGEHIWDTVECYREGSGWSISSSKTIGKRCFLSAVAL
ncbi:uncharacterized protein LOC135586389 isoform X1 [Musa acuminata AAA Group]|uniref:uncharacterized protein LOC135586389 isoform X1 n=2 Tax=Musa acuminata AAA Group TaxID=214697 RepID=UPI0031E19065